MPAKSRFGLWWCSRTTYTGPLAGRFAMIGVQVRPKSVVLNRYGLKSLLRWPSKATYAVPSALGDATTRLTYVSSGTPGKRSKRVHVCPPSRESCTRPSSVPTQSTPRARGDSSIVLMLP